MNKDNLFNFGSIVAIVALIAMASVAILNENRIEIGGQGEGALGSTLYYSTALSKMERYNFDSGLITDLNAIRLPLSGLKSATASWNPPSIATTTIGAAYATTTITVAGAAAGDLVLANLATTTNADLWSIAGNVSATDTVMVSLFNNSGEALDLDTTTLIVRVLPQSSFVVPAALVSATTSAP